MGSRINHLSFHKPVVGGSFGWSCDGIGGSEQHNGNGAKGKDLIGGPSGHRIELVVGSLPDTCTLSAAVVSSRLLLGQPSVPFW